MHTYEASRVLAAPRARVWDVVSDVAGLATHAPNLGASEVVEGSGKGMVRRCYNNAGAGWSETCTLWDPGRRYTMEVDTSDYPYPLRTMRGTWAVEDDPGGTRIHLRYDYELKYGVAGRVLGAVMRPVFARTCRKLLDSYQAALGLPASEDQVHLQVLLPVPTDRVSVARKLVIDFGRFLAHFLARTATGQKDRIPRRVHRTIGGEGHSATA